MDRRVSSDSNDSSGSTSGVVGVSGCAGVIAPGSRSARLKSIAAWRAGRWRRAATVLIPLALFALLLMRLGENGEEAHRRLLLAVAGGGAAAAATAAGTLPVLLARRFSSLALDCFLGLGAGVMLAATAFSLLLPALASAAPLAHSRMGASMMVALGMLAGVAAIIGMDRAIGPAPLTDALGVLPRGDAAALRRVWLFMLAISLHNVPEGMAIGVAYAGIDLDKAGTLASAIALQDLPEGLVVALAFRSVGFGRWRAAGLGVLSGLVEPVGAVVGVALVEAAAVLLPVGLAGAAGAMLYVIVSEVVPEAQQHGNGRWASAALALGFAIMMVLDTALG